MPHLHIILLTEREKCPALSAKCENSASVIPAQQLQEFSSLLVLSKEPPLTVWDRWALIHLVLVCLCVGLASCGSSGNGANYTV